MFQAMFSALSKVAPTTGSVPVQKVARAMLTTAITPSDSKVDILDNKAIHRLAELV